MFNRSKIIRVVSACLIGFSIVTHTAAQVVNPTPPFDANPKPSDETKKIKKQIVNIGTGNDVSIRRREGPALRGTITKIDTDSVKINDIDLKTNVEIAYEQIIKVAKGSGSPDSLAGKKLSGNHGRTLTWVVLAAGAVVPLIIWAATRGKKTSAVPAK